MIILCDNFPINSRVLLLAFFSLPLFIFIELPLRADAMQRSSPDPSTEDSPTLPHPTADSGDSGRDVAPHFSLPAAASDELATAIPKRLPLEDDDADKSQPQQIGRKRLQHQMQQKVANALAASAGQMLESFRSVSDESGGSARLNTTQTNNNLYTTSNFMQSGASSASQLPASNFSSTTSPFPKPLQKNRSTPLSSFLQWSEAQLRVMPHEQLVTLFMAFQRVFQSSLAAVNGSGDEPQNSSLTKPGSDLRRRSCSRQSVRDGVEVAHIVSRRSSFRTATTTPATPPDAPQLLSAAAAAGETVFECSDDSSTHSRAAFFPRPRSTHSLKKDVLSATATKMLNQYEVIGDLGRGSCGKVKLGFDTILNKLVAIKIVKKPSGFGTGRSHAQQGALLREIAIMKKLRHKHIVSLLEVINDPDVQKIYIVLEYIDNGPLGKIHESLQCQSIEPTRLLWYARQITAGLSYLHKNNIVHRDIKPENILVNNKYRAFLADFGVSQLVGNTQRQSIEESRFTLRSNPGDDDDDDGEGLSSKHAEGSNPVGQDERSKRPRLLKGAKGTVLFMSPELLLSGESEDGFAVDMWALGVTFWTLLCGEMPFSSIQDIQEMAKLDETQQFSRLFQDRDAFAHGALEHHPLREAWTALLQRLFEIDVDKRMTARQAHRAIKVALALHEEEDAAMANNLSLWMNDDEVDKALTTCALTTPQREALLLDVSMTLNSCAGVMDDLVDDDSLKVHSPRLSTIAYQQSSVLAWESPPSLQLLSDPQEAEAQEKAQTQKPFPQLLLPSATNQEHHPMRFPPLPVAPLPLGNLCHPWGMSESNDSSFSSFLFSNAQPPAHPPTHEGSLPRPLVSSVSPRNYRVFKEQARHGAGGAHADDDDDEEAPRTTTTSPPGRAMHRRANGTQSPIFKLEPLRSGSPLGGRSLPRRLVVESSRGSTYSSIIRNSAATQRLSSLGDGTATSASTRSSTAAASWIAGGGGSPSAARFAPPEEGNHHHRQSNRSEVASAAFANLLATQDAVMEDSTAG